jgi:hypothetical protein
VYVAGREDTAGAAMEALTAPGDDRATRLDALSGNERYTIQLSAP